MNGMPPQDAELAARYLKRLRRALRPLPEGDRTDIVAEIESHITERSSAGELRTQNVLAALGDPETLARSYVEDHELLNAVHRASPLPLLATALGRATRSATAFLVGLVGVIAYAFAISLAAVAVLKPIAPRNVGLWRGPDNVNFGFLSTPPSTPELLGLWIAPLALVGALAFYLAGTGLMKLWGRRLLRRSRATAPA